MAQLSFSDRAEAVAAETAELILFGDAEQDIRPSVMSEVYLAWVRPDATTHRPFQEEPFVAIYPSNALLVLVIGEYAEEYNFEAYSSSLFALKHFGIKSATGYTVQELTRTQFELYEAEAELPTLDSFDLLAEDRHEASMEALKHYWSDNRSYKYDSKGDLVCCGTWYENDYPNPIQLFLPPREAVNYICLPPDWKGRIHEMEGLTGSDDPHFLAKLMLTARKYLPEEQAFEPLLTAIS